MAVGGVKGGGGKGGKAGGPTGAKGPAAGKVAPAESAEELGESSETLPGASTDIAGPALARSIQKFDRALSAEFCAQIARTVPNWEGQVRALVAEVLKQNLRIDSKVLTDRIAEKLQQDPRFKRKLERLLSKG